MFALPRSVLPFSFNLLYFCRGTRQACKRLWRLQEPPQRFGCPVQYSRFLVLFIFFFIFLQLSLGRRVFKLLGKNTTWPVGTSAAGAVVLPQLLFIPVRPPAAQRWLCCWQGGLLIKLLDCYIGNEAGKPETCVPGHLGYRSTSMGFVGCFWLLCVSDLIAGGFGA